MEQDDIGKSQIYVRTLETGRKTSIWRTFIAYSLQVQIHFIRIHTICTAM